MWSNKRVLLRHHRADKLVTYHGLGHVYDLERDPLEVNSLWDDPSAATLRANLTQHSFDATMAACDPGPEPTFSRTPGIKRPTTYSSRSRSTLARINSGSRSPQRESSFRYSLSACSR